MKGILIGFVLAAVLAAGIVLGFKARANDQLTNAAATYLFSETEVKGKDGKPMSRADLLDALLREAIIKANAPVK